MIFVVSVEMSFMCWNTSDDDYDDDDDGEELLICEIKICARGDSIHFCCSDVKCPFCRFSSISCFIRFSLPYIPTDLCPLTEFVFYIEMPKVLTSSFGEHGIFKSKCKCE